MAIIENIKKRIRLKNIYRNIKSREFDKALSLIEEIEEEKLDEHFPGLKEKYIDRFGNTYECDAPDADRLNKVYYQICSKLRLATQMKFYTPVDPQISLF